MKQPQLTIATLGSHSALQILKGAKDEGFRTIAICKKGYEDPYRIFRVADIILSVRDFRELPRFGKRLRAENAVIIPHGSFISFLGHKAVEKLTIPYYGNKKILKWESDRNLERKWLERSGLKVPRIFPNPKKIDRPVIVKFHGAGGGKEYFIANSEKDFKERLKRARARTGAPYVIQEYVVGVPIYAHYFFSPLTDELEIMGFDKRYESNVDSLGRIAARDQLSLELESSYVIVGNIPIVVRESYLQKFFSMGQAVVRESRKIAPPGLFGPFCLETIVTPSEEIYVFEISARIVAGTNPYIQGSPYSWLSYNEPMSTGRRIAREIKTALATGQLKRIIS